MATATKTIVINVASLEMNGRTFFEGDLFVLFIMF